MKENNKRNERKTPEKSPPEPRGLGSIPVSRTNEAGSPISGLSVFFGNVSSDHVEDVVDLGFVHEFSIKGAGEYAIICGK